MIFFHAGFHWFSSPPTLGIRPIWISAVINSFIFTPDEYTMDLPTASGIVEQGETTMKHYRKELSFHLPTAEAW